MNPKRLFVIGIAPHEEEETTTTLYRSEKKSKAVENSLNIIKS